jgi:hypothetical protein
MYLFKGKKRVTVNKLGILGLHAPLRKKKEMVGNQTIW